MRLADLAFVDLDLVPGAPALQTEDIRDPVPRFFQDRGRQIGGGPASRNRAEKRGDVRSFKDGDHAAESPEHRRPVERRLAP